MSKSVLLLTIVLLLSVHAIMADDILTRFSEQHLTASECPLIKNQWLCYFSQLCTWYSGKCHAIRDAEQKSEETMPEGDIPEELTREITEPKEQDQVGADWGCPYFKDPAACWLQWHHCHWQGGKGISVDCKLIIIIACLASIESQDNIKVKEEWVFKKRRVYP
ncbi:hypothetical protein DFA_04891 [Cavenderia fasciculata]|uniref:Uncharacterized protein n=1 Tax=Cavenderia fasciculata TaxID=261658 RepID=F4PMB1_CACFS|nr:uncharacterized protein DFA_04891 [Cavenderia fasciculata]EGG22761.1 hypothetical protein DFA_04891 [Cavenderia fasciculata]|eukprot:XP_004360612.1 hypothetical protein DFA_04891 [Cavenderia fasciculata]